MNFASCLTEVRLELRWKSHRMSFYTDFTFFYRSVIVRFFFLLYDIEVKMREKRKSSHELGRLRQRKKNMTYKEIKKNEEVLAYLKKGNDNLGTMGFTDHSDAHCAMVAERAAMILKKFGYSDHDIELVKIAGFMHDMGNSMGGLGAYMKLIDKYDMYHGGFIWDFIDQAILVKDQVTGKEVLRYGGDFDDKPADYEFSANGIVFADRKEKPAMQEVRYYYGLYR